MKHTPNRSFRRGTCLALAAIAGLTAAASV